MIIKTTEALVPKRNRAPNENLFESTAEWRDMKAVIDAGLAPETAPGKKDAKVVICALTDARKKSIGLTARRTYFRFVQAYVKANKLPYRVESKRHGDKDFVVVLGARAKKSKSPKA